MAGLVATLNAAVVYIGGTRYPVPAASLTLADNSTTLIVAKPTGYAQVVPPAVPVAGTAAIISLIVTSGGSIVKEYDVRQYGGVTGNNAAPPSTFPGITSASIVPFVEGVGTIGVNISLTLAAPLDRTIQSAGFTYAVADSGKWHQFSAAVTDATNVQTATGTIHGLDPDQALDFAFQAVGIDGTPLPTNPLLIGSIPAQSVPTPIAKVIVPRDSPTYDPSNPLASGQIVVRHFQGADLANTSTVMGDDGVDSYFNHANMSVGVQALLDALGNILGSGGLQTNVPGSVQYGTDMMLGIVIGGSPFPVSFYIFGTGGSGTAPKIWFPSAPASPMTLTSYGTSGSPISLPAPLTSSLNTDTIYVAATNKPGSIAGVINTYAANVLQNSTATGNGWTVFAQKNADFSADLYAILNADGFAVTFTSRGGSVTFAGGSAGSTVKPGGGKAQGGL